MNLALRILALLAIILPSPQFANARILPGGDRDDEQTSIVYDAQWGEVAVNAPVSTELTSISIYSANGIFSSDLPRCFAKLCQDLDANTLFRATFGESFGDFSWGNVAQPRLEEQFLLDDLHVVGSLAGGAGLGDVDLIYIPVPEPPPLLLVFLGSMGLFCWRALTQVPRQRSGHRCLDCAR